VDKSEGNKFVAMAMRFTGKQPSGVGVKFTFATGARDNEVGKAIFENFLPMALAEGKYLASPEPHVVGKGLENVQAGLNFLKKGVSAKKVVVSL